MPQYMYMMCFGRVSCDENQMKIDASVCTNIVPKCDIFYEFNYFYAEGY